MSPPRDAGRRTAPESQHVDLDVTAEGLARTRADDVMPDKRDFKRTLDAYQAPKGRFRIVDVPDLQYLTVDGHGHPDTSASLPLPPSPRR